MRIISAVCLLFLAASGIAAPLIEVPRTATPPRIDGIPSPGEWENALEFTGLQKTNDTGFAREQTIFRLEWDDNFIYVLAKCLDRNPALLNKGNRYNDCVELFFMAPGSGNVVQWLFYSNGESSLNFIDSEFGGGYPCPTGPVQSAVAVGKDNWTVEARIPAESFKMTSFSSLRRYRFNACRSFSENLGPKKDGRGAEFSAFAYVRGQYLKPLDFADMILADSGSETVRLEKMDASGAKLAVPRGAEVWVRYFDGTVKHLVPENEAVEFSWPESCTGFALTVLNAGESCFGNTWHLFPEDPAKFDAIRAAQRKTQGLGIGTAHSMKRIFRQNPFAEQSNDISISAAGNEQENVQIVLFSGQKGVEDIRLSASDFVSADGNVIPKVAASLYLETDAIADEVGYPTVNGSGNYPDPLDDLPAHLELPPESVRAVWVSIHVPPAASAGLYHGKITISAKGQNPQTVNVFLRVRNFTLPVKQSYRTAFCIWEREFYRLFVEKNDNTPEHFEKLLDQYAMLLVRNRLTPLILNTPWLLPPAIIKDIEPQYELQPDGSCRVKADRYDRLVTKYLDAGATGFQMGPMMPQARKQHYRMPDGWPQIWQAVETHYKANGMIDRGGFAYPFDEPGNQRADNINRLTKVIHENAPDVKILLTGADASFPSRKFHNIDIWVPALHWVNMRGKEEQQAAGKEVWNYPCSGPWYPYPNYHLDIEPGAWRILPWMGYKYKFDGLLYWAVAFYNVKNTRRNNSYSCNGDGVLVYPRADGTPIPSIRLKVICDSMEDYEYLKLLEHAADRAASNSAQAALVKEARQLLNLDGMVRDLDDYALRQSEYDGFRNHAADLIEKLKK